MSILDRLYNLLALINWTGDPILIPDLYSDILFEASLAALMLASANNDHLLCLVFCGA